MNKNEYVAKRLEIKRRARKYALIWALGCVAFIVWYLIQFGPGAQTGTHPLWAGCFLVYFFGSAVLAMWYDCRFRQRHGLLCPKCPKYQSLIAGVDLSTGKCRRCGEIVFNN